MSTISSKERNILRELAKRQAEIAALPIMDERRKRWYDLNDGKVEYPIVTMEYHGLELDVYPPLTCENPLARGLEAQMSRQLFKYETYRDDRVIPPSVTVGIPNWIRPFDFSAESFRPKDETSTTSMAYMYTHPVNDFEADFGVFKPSKFTVDVGLKEANKNKAFVEELIGDILPVRLTFPGFVFCPGHILIQMMSMETMYLAFMDYPDLFHKMMRQLTDDYHAFMDAIEAGGAIIPNNDQSSVLMDTYGYTHDLPGIGELNRPVKFSDVWSYTNFQETVSMSPTMFNEFFFGYTREIIDRTGLHSYGCCEPVHSIWELCLSKLPNLRKLSISPWCDEEYMGEVMRGKKIVYQRKPFPNFFSSALPFDEEAFKKHMEKTVKAARGCPLEVTFRDICSVYGEPQRLTRAVELTREVFAKHWQG